MAPGWPPYDADLEPAVAELLAEFAAYAGRVILECAREAATEVLAALCVEGEEEPGGLHLLTESRRVALLDDGVDPALLWNSYATWDAEPHRIDGASWAAHEGTITALARALGDAVPIVVPGVHLWARAARFVTDRAPGELAVTRDFLAFALPNNPGEIWGSLWLSSTPTAWELLRARGLVPDDPRRSS
jgi:hypothetical protein